MMNKQEKSEYNRAYRIKHRERIEAMRAERRAGLGEEVRRCKVPGCDGVYDAKGYCARHYMAVRRTGSPEGAGQVQHHGKTLEERFWLRVRKGRGCWEWTAARNASGYGVMRVGPGNTLAPRVSYELANGPVPDGLYVLHRCDNPACVRPAHLFLGTLADNIADMDVKGRRRSAPLVGSKNPSAKLSERKVLAIRASGDTGAVLARRYGVSQTVISDVRHRKIWKHVE